MKEYPISQQRIEIVERKGIGHPDSMIDGICESASRVLSKFYIKEKGFILHHNLDKGLIVGGVADPIFGGGKVIQPPEIIVAGTASIVRNIDDIRKLLYDETIEYLDKHLRFAKLLNPEIKIKIHPGSVDLVDLYNRFNNGQTPLANDTSFGVGFAPLTKLEKTVLEIEKFLNEKNIKKKYPFVGEDIKVMGVRDGNKIKLTLAIAFVSEFVSSLDEYYNQKAKIKEILQKKFGDDIDFSINTADSGNSIYLTVSGVSWENGDDGQVGRGNRCNGLITPFHLMSLEAVAGKNPVSHVGKIYNLKAQELAEKIHKTFELKDVQVILVSQIGKPIDEPFVGVKYLDTGRLKEKELIELIQKSLTKESFKELTNKLISNSITVF